MKFFKTTKNKRHYHIVYISQSGEGETSLDKNHKHNVIFTPGAQEIINPETGVLIQDARQPEWTLELAEDEHTHTLTEIIPKQQKEKYTDKEKVNSVKELYKYAKELENKSRKNGIESEGFYDGEKQWDSKIKNSLKNEKRAVLTINEIEPKIDLLSGHQRQNRTDIKFFPVENGDSGVADILNVLVKTILEKNNFSHEESKTFYDVLIPGRGIFNIYIDWDKNIRGEIVVENFQWQNVYFGEHEKEDLSDLEYLVKRKLYSKAKVKQLWPKKAKEIQKEYELRLDAISDNAHIQYSSNQYNNSDNSTSVSIISDDTNADYINIKKKEFNILECWQKEYKQIFVLQNIIDGFTYVAENWLQKDINAVKTIKGFKKIPRKIFKMKRTIIAMDVLLEEDYTEDFFLKDEFPVIPVYAKKRKNKFWGKVEPAKGIQREINKRHSQIVDIINKTANYGYYYDSQTFIDDRQKRNFIQNCSSPGFTVEVANINRPPLKEQGIKFPSEIVNLEAMSTDKLREIMNINPELLGINSRAESGVAIMEKKRQGLTGNEFLFDNLSIAKKKMAKIIVKLIQKIYTPERIYRILANRSQRENIEINNQPFDQINKEDIITLLEEADLTKYDVAVGENAYNPTTRHANFVIWAEMARNGFPVPPGLLIEQSDLPEKDKWKDAINQIQQQQAEAERRKVDAEVEKSLIAARSKEQNLQ